MSSDTADPAAMPWGALQMYNLASNSVGVGRTWVAAPVAVFLICIAAASADERTPPAVSSSDTTRPENVRLFDGALRGTASPGERVRVEQASARSGGEAAVAASASIVRADDQGRFVAAVNGSGLVRLSTARGVRVVRVWAAAAPPSAVPAVSMDPSSISPSPRVVRGQSGAAQPYASQEACRCQAACECEPSVFDRCAARAGSAKWFVLAGIGAVAVIELADDEPPSTQPNFAPTSP